MDYNIFIIGCGATGSNLTMQLSQLAYSQKNINEIILIDGDIVETKNFRNQKFSKKDVNHSKAQALAKRYKLLCNISYIDKYLKAPEELVDLLINCHDTTNIIVSCVDNNKCRRILNDVFYNEKIDKVIYIDVGNGSGNNRFGQMVIGAKENGKVCSNPVSSYYPEILIEDMDEKEIEDFSCSQIEKHPQHLATNVFSSTMAFIAVSNIVCFQKVPKKYLMFDTDQISITVPNQ